MQIQRSTQSRLGTGEAEGEEVQPHLVRRTRLHREPEQILKSGTGVKGPTEDSPACLTEQVTEKKGHGNGSKSKE